MLNTHLRFIAREIFQFGLRVDEQRTVPDSPTLQETFAEIFPRAEIVFVTGGLGPTSDDITRELVSEFLNLELLENSPVHEAISRRLALRRIPATERIWRQALVPRGGQVLPNENGTAPGIYIAGEYRSENPVTPFVPFARSAARIGADVPRFCRAYCAQNHRRFREGRDAKLSYRQHGRIHHRKEDWRRGFWRSRALSLAIAHDPGKPMSASLAALRLYPKLK